MASGDDGIQKLVSIANIQPKYESPNVYHPGVRFDDYQHLQRILCDIAQMDAWHDHHNISNLTNNDIQEYVSLGQNDCNRTKISANEPSFLNTILFDTNIQRQQPQDPEPSSDYYHPIISDRYVVKHVKCRSGKWINESTYQFNGIQYTLNVGLPITETEIEEEPVAGVDEDDDDIDNNIKVTQDSMNTMNNYLRDKVGSKLQNALIELGITVPIYVFRDVGYGNFPDDTCLWKDNGNDEKIITLVDPVCIYDPGPTISATSKSGKRHGFTSVTSRSLYAVSHNRTIIDIPSFSSSTSTLTPETLMYTKYKCTLHTNLLTLSDNLTTANATNFFNSMNSTLYVHREDAPKKSCVYIETSDTSKKAKSNHDLPFKEVIETLGCLWPKFPVDSPKIITETYKRIMTASGAMKILTKKFGDHGIATATLNSVIEYKLFQPTVTGFTIQNSITNGMHMFLSYDAVAVRSALEYGAPIVCYNTHEGFIVFVSKKISDKFGDPRIIIERHIKIALKRVIILIKEIVNVIHIITEYKTNIERYDGLYDDIETQIGEQLDPITKIVNYLLTHISSIDSSTNDKDIDRQFHTFLCTFYEFAKYYHLCISCRTQLVSLQTPRQIQDFRMDEEVITLTQTLLLSINDDDIKKTLENAVKLLLSIINKQDIQELIPSASSILELIIKINEFLEQLSTLDDPNSVLTELERLINTSNTSVIRMFNSDIIKNMQLIISNYKLLIGYESNILNIVTLFRGSLTKIDIFITPPPAVNGRLQLVKLYEEITDIDEFSQKLLADLQLQHKKTTFFIQSMNGLVEYITPFENSKNGRITRCYGFGTGQKTIEFGSHIIQEVCKSLVLYDDLFTVFVQQLMLFFAKCINVGTDMRPVIGASITDLKSIINGIRSEHSQPPIFGGKKRGTKLKKKMNITKKNMKNKQKIYGGHMELVQTFIENPDVVAFIQIYYTIIMQSVGAAFLIMYIFTFLYLTNPNYSNISNISEVCDPSFFTSDDIDIICSFIDTTISQFNNTNFNLRIDTNSDTLRYQALLDFCIGSKYTEWGKHNRNNLYKCNKYLSKYIDHIDTRGIIDTEDLMILCKELYNVYIQPNIGLLTAYYTVLKIQSDNNLDIINDMVEDSEDFIKAGINSVSIEEIEQERLEQENPEETNRKRVLSPFPNAWVRPLPNAWEQRPFDYNYVPPPPSVQSNKRNLYQQLNTDQMNNYKDKRIRVVGGRNHIRKTKKKNTHKSLRKNKRKTYKQK